MAARAGFSIEDLRKRPEFAAAIADRVWRAWWRDCGVPLATIAGLVADNLSDAPIPSAVVAFRADQFLGAASLIACDLNARAQLTPWVAAVWVEPDARNQGVGASLVEAAADTAFNSGAGIVYLCCLPLKRAFYEHLGWGCVEEDVGESRLTVLKLSSSRQSSGA